MASVAEENWLKFNLEKVLCNEKEREVSRLVVRGRGLFRNRLVGIDVEERRSFRLELCVDEEGEYVWERSLLVEG